MTAPLILLVDDEAEASRKLCVLLRAAGFDAAFTLTGEGTLTMIRHGLKPDVAVIDLVLSPPIDGNKLAVRMRELIPGVKIVILSGYTQTLQPGTEALVDGVVAKPAEWQEFAEVIRKLLGRPEDDPCD